MKSTSSLLVLATMAVSAFGFSPSPASFGRPRSSVVLQMSDLNTGKVKWFNTVKGFGFIVPDDGSDDVFVHQTAIIADGFRSLSDGEAVEYKTETDDTGRRKAVNVTGPDGSAVQGAAFQPQNDEFGF